MAQEGGENLGGADALAGTVDNGGAVSASATATNLAVVAAKGHGAAVSWTGRPSRLAGFAFRL